MIYSPTDPRLPEHLRARIAVESDSGCWLWTGPLNPHGYGRITVAGRKWLTHRVTYTRLVGTIPEGLELDHVKARGCAHRHCCNPEHLEPVTHRENVLRGDSVAAVHAAKTTCPEGHPYSATFASDGGRRRCRTCRNERERARYHRAKMSA